MPLQRLMTSGGHRVEVVDLVSSGDEGGSVTSGGSVYWMESEDLGLRSSLGLEPATDPDRPWALDVTVGVDQVLVCLACVGLPCRWRRVASLCWCLL